MVELLQAVAQGAFALTFAIICVFLWKKMEAKDAKIEGIRREYEGDPDDLERKPGKLVAQRREQDTRFDALRTIYEKKLSEKQDREDDLLLKYQDLILQMARALNIEEPPRREKERDR